ncbi:hypothetical protein ES332_D13G164600v1 [Gossypium tomentosum]|uniref:Uncharacterized protein n=1 Tax=Gossypium tomentosum TaxID=34277 RepID=A0A5D2HXY7_GOSTO|nr:hypothetical protein ES332_D13G164600v1 [Gossypium tomentosum]
MDLKAKVQARRGARAQRRSTRVEAQNAQGRTCGAMSWMLLGFLVLFLV